MTERVGLEVTVDARQANAEIASIRKGAMQLKESLEKQAGAIGAVTMAFGHQDGAIGKVIRGVGGLAVAFGTAGPLGVALAATAAAVELLNSHWEEQIELQDKALMASFSERDKASALLKKTNDDIAKMRDELEPLTKAQRDYRDTMREVAEVEARMAQIRKGITTDAGDDNRAALRMYEQAIERLQAKANLQQAIIGKGAATTKGAAGRTSADEKLGGTTESISEVMLGGGPGETRALMVEIEKEREKARQHAIDMEIDQRAAHIEFMQKMTEDAEIARTEFEREQAAERVRIEEEAALRKQASAQHTADVITSGLISVVAMSAELAMGDAKSHKAIMAAMLGATVSSAGGFITMKGGEAFAAGLSRALITSGADPGAWVAMGGGAAMIAAGQAVQQGGPSAINALLAIRPAGGSGGAASGGGGVGTGERGFGRRSKQSGGSSADSGPLQIVNVYGVDGPQAEDQARRTVRDLRLADRRRLRR